MFGQAHANLLLLSRDPFTEDYDKHLIGYMLVSMQIIHGFLNRYYDPTTFKAEEEDHETGNFALTASNIQNLLSVIYSKVKDILDLKSTNLCEADSHHVYEALHTLSLLLSDAEAAPEKTAAGQASEKETTDEEELYVNEFEENIMQKFAEFKEALGTDEKLSETIRKESIQFVRVLESIPFVADEEQYSTELRYEPFIRKLVSHVYESIEIVNNERY